MSIYCSFELNYYNLREITVISVIPTVSVTRPEGGGGYSHIKVTGMLVGKLKLNPYGRPMWVWLKLKLTPKTDILITVKDLKKKGLLCSFLKMRFL